MSKSPSRGPEYSREREFKVILEHIESQFKTFGEGLQGVIIRLDKIEIRLDRIENDVDHIKIDLGIIKSAFPRFAIQPKNFLSCGLNSGFCASH